MSALSFLLSPSHKPCDPQQLLALVRACMADSQVARAIRHSQRPLEDWGRDLARIQGMSWYSSTNASLPLQAFLKLSLDNLMGALVGFRGLVGALAQDALANRSYDALLLTAAIRETIEVLERTRHKHPCEELGELRRRLEKLMKNSAQVSPQPAEKRG